MKKNYIVFTFVFLFISSTIKSQVIDNYGISIGMGISNQFWNYSDQDPDHSDWKKNKPGLTAFFYVEKELNNFLSVQPEIGYTSKGFREEIIFTDAMANVIDEIDGKIVLYNMSINLKGLIKPFSINPNLYFILGLRSDFMLDYKTYEINLEESNYKAYVDLLEEYKTFLLSGLIGFRVDFNNKIFVDMAYNPAITKNYKSSYMSINDRMIEFTVGINLRKSD